MVKKGLLPQFLTGIMLLAAVHIYMDGTSIEKDMPDLYNPEETEELPDYPLTLNEYGIPEGELTQFEGRVQRNQTLSVILSGFNVSASLIHQVAGYSRELFDVRRIRAGDRYKIFHSNDSLGLPRYFIYQPNDIEFVRVTLYEPVSIERGSREVTRVLNELSGTINSSLWNAMVESGSSPVLALELSEIYAWTVDFFGLQRGDSFKAFYYENYVGSNPAGIDRIVAAWFSHMGREFYAIPFEQDSVMSFFDQDGNSLRRTLLRAPLRYSRISSGFSHSRMHPILRVRRPHHGVDYAAPVGTPVYAIGDGRIIETSYTAGAGRMVRIRHNSVYTSAYLHLRNFEPGIRPDVWVRQGDVIGYVGTTGMSTGPHLDFRMWRNGQPVDPLSIEAPPVEPVKEENLEDFERVKRMWMGRLDSL